MQSEIWKDIVNYEGLYKVSNFGRVKSLLFGKERIIKQITNNKGYSFVNLYKNGTQKYMTVHRLVATAFIENTFNLPEINHKNENKTDNSVKNLEWCTTKYNSNYGTRTKRSSIAKTNGKCSKKVEQYLNGTKIAEFPSTNEVKRVLGFSNGYISRCCNGLYKQAYGYQWKYVE